MTLCGLMMGCFSARLFLSLSVRPCLRFLSVRLVFFSVCRKPPPDLSYICIEDRGNKAKHILSVDIKSLIGCFLCPKFYTLIFRVSLFQKLRYPSRGFVGIVSDIVCTFSFIEKIILSLSAKPVFKPFLSISFRGSNFRTLEKCRIYGLFTFQLLFSMSKFRYPRIARNSVFMRSVALPAMLIFIVYFCVDILKSLISCGVQGCYTL